MGSIRIGFNGRMEYLKINTLFKRDLEAKGKKKPIIEGEYSDPVFENIKKWCITEKIDGMNTRIFYNSIERSIYFDGRTNDAQLPATLFNYLKDHFTLQRLGASFATSTNVMLVGEGYGKKINGNPYKMSKVEFILFDICIGGWWMERNKVAEIAEDLEILSVPQIGIMTIDEIVDHVKLKPLTRLEWAPQDTVAEGIVATAEPMVLTRDGKPVKFKLKVKDFE